MTITEKDKEAIARVFRIKSGNDQKDTVKENSLVENQPEIDPETKAAKKGNMKRGKKA